MNVKWLRRIKLTAGPDDDEGRDLEIHDPAAGRQTLSIRLPDEVKSVITHPVAGFDPEGPGFYEISGLAWSGYGKIARSRSRPTAAKLGSGGPAGAGLAEGADPLPPPWRWDGGPAVLQSRATDISGYVQPTRGAVDRRTRRQARSITSMASRAGASGSNGEVRHVYV